MSILLIPILLPVIAAGIVFLIPRRLRSAADSFTLAVTAANLALAVVLFRARGEFSLPWLGSLAEFSLRLYDFSAFIIISAAGFCFLISLYSFAFLKGKGIARQFYAYLLITLSFVNGAVLADNLLVLLFFWEGLLVTIFAMIAIGGGRRAMRSAVKALVIIGITDLCMMLGIALAGRIAGTLSISGMSIPLTFWGSLAFILLTIGAVSKAGSMPFHSWIPDAAVDSPLPFMALLPAALEKLLGIYFLSRICLDMFRLVPSSPLSTLLMVTGVVTILLAVMMALVQKDYKRLLSYHAISQVGYMILGIGTMVPAGIVGGIFHMINHAMYKSGLFLTGGSVERQSGTTDLTRLGGLGKSMPVTFACFLVFAASISGVPPFNGFFSKELVYDGALERGMVFYLLALAGSFLTAASFLKLGHSAYLGKRESAKTPEAPAAMLIPMLVIAVMCVLFGVYNPLPLNYLVQPAVGAERLEGHSFAGFHANIFLVSMTVAVLAAALLNHLFGVRKYGSAIKSVDHIHYAPGLRQVYDKAEKGWFDPYNIGIAAAGYAARMLYVIDRAVDWLYESAVVRTVSSLSSFLRRVQPSNYPGYIAWSLGGAALAALFLMLVIGG